MIRIITDSTADLNEDLITGYSIEVVPLYVSFEDEIYQDGVTLTKEAFLEKINSSPIFPRTSQPTPVDFVEVFRRILDEGDQILFIGISSDMSGTISSALLAQSELGSKSIAVVDSRNISMGIGLLVKYAAELAQKGVSLPELAGAVEKAGARVKTTFIVDTLDFLYKGGRLSRAQALIGNVLNIHPRIEVKEGKLVLVEKIRGRREKAWERMIEEAMANMERIDPRMLAVTHSYAEEEALWIKAELEKVFPAAKDQIMLTQAGAVISSHCGPGTVGILYLEKE